MCSGSGLFRNETHPRCTVNDGPSAGEPVIRPEINRAAKVRDLCGKIGYFRGKYRDFEARLERRRTKEERGHEAGTDQERRASEERNRPGAGRGGIPPVCQVITNGIFFVPRHRSIKPIAGHRSAGCNRAKAKVTNEEERGPTLRRSSHH